MFERKYIIFLFLFIICYFNYSQVVDTKISLIANQFQDFSKKKNSDLLYLQTNKGIYETQEDIWFKGYVLDAQLFLPSENSKTLFVQLIEDKTDKTVWEEKYEIESGFVNGHLYLNDSLQVGSYTLAAYSSSSFYKDTKEFHAVRKLQILKDIKSKANLEFAKKDSILHFTTFPEGGDLVSGIQNRITFKAENAKGLPIGVSGTLYENNIPIVEFKSMHAGMGSFLFTPNSNNNYHIQLTKPQKDTIYYLPKIIHSGKTLQLLNTTKSHVIFKISQTPNLTEETIYLRIQTRGILYSVAMGTLMKELIIKIPLKDIPQGIAEVTLFNENIEPIEERLIYVNLEKKLNIKTILNKSEYVTREKTILKIKVTDQNNEPVITHLGLSVFDKLYQNKLDTKNILTHFYLSTQLQGNIYNPAYYFNEDSKNRLEALNLLLLTQGWRRYVWSEDNLKKQHIHTQPLLSDSIVGKVRLERITKKSKIEGQKMVMVYTSGSLKGKDLIMADPIGVFSINYNHLKMAEKGYLYIKPMTPEKPKYLIKINDNSFNIINKNRKKVITKYPFPKLKEETLTDDREPLIVSDEVNKLKEVVLSTKKKQVFRDKYLGTLDSLAKLDISKDYVGIPCGTLNCQVHPYNRSKKPVEGEVYYYVKGFKWNTNGEGVYTITSSGYMTYKYPELTEGYLLKKFNLRMIKGYYGKREFYNPKYNEETVKDPFPDYRNTLFWKPDIITNENGEATIEFYCSDINTKFIGIIEGIDGSGLIGNKKFDFRVRKSE